MGCLLCSIYGLANAHLRDRRPNRLPLRERVLLGTLFTLNYLPTNYALLYISYPLQVVAKNTRYLLVIIVGIFFSRVKKSRSLKLPPSKLLIGILISVGAALFMLYETVFYTPFRRRKLNICSWTRLKGGLAIYSSLLQSLQMLFSVMLKLIAKPTSLPAQTSSSLPLISMGLFSYCCLL
jgi:hypothetical protein